MKVITKINRLREKIKKINAEISQIQNDCSHEDVTKKHGGSTGNYDPSCDYYSTTFHCKECDKSWTEYRDAHTYSRNGF